MKRALLGGVAALSLVSSSAMAQHSPVPAYRVANFLQTLGVNGHLNQHSTDPGYATAVANSLAAAGITLLRTGGTHLAQSELAVLAANPKVRFDIIAETFDTTEQLPRWQALAAKNALYSLEGPDEPNNFTVTYPPGSANTCGGLANNHVENVVCAEFQRDFFAFVTNPANGISNTPVIDYSEQGAKNIKSGWWGDAEIIALAQNTPFTAPNFPDNNQPVAGTQYAHQLNMHSYWAGTCTPSNWGDNRGWQAATPNLTGVCIDGEYGNAVFLWGGAGNAANTIEAYDPTQVLTIPAVVTETGGDSCPDAGPCKGKQIPETLFSKATLDFYLDWFTWQKDNWTAINFFGAQIDPYELYDADGSGDQKGFFHAYVMGGPAPTPKPVVGYLANQAKILADNGPTALTFTTGTFDYSVVSAPQSCANTNVDPVHNVLFQRSDGKFIIAVWDERDTSPNVTGPQGDVVTIKFNDGLTHIWTMFDPTKGASAQLTGNGTSIAVQNFSDHPKYYLINN